MDRPWTEERSVDVELARGLIAARFPDLVPGRVELLGVGWDNTAYLVDRAWVFRFPRREVAAPLLRTECAILPALARRLPLPVPIPTRIGVPEPRFPWPFAGYRLIPGRVASDAGLDEAARRRAAVPLARFLAALHAVPTEVARELGAGPDALERLGFERRARQIEERLAAAARRGLLEGVRPWSHVLEQTPGSFVPSSATLVHGDLHAGNVLVNDEALPCGIIDWGDVHLGDAAVDLSIAHGFLPPAARDDFLACYGEVDGDRWRMARFRALQVAAVLLVYAADVGAANLLREARTALGYLRS